LRIVNKIALNPTQYLFKLPLSLDID
jgi:hypothetical protein